MRVTTNQTKGFADDAIQVPERELETMNAFINWPEFEPYFYDIAGDYPVLSLFKVLRLQSWFSLSDSGVSSA